ncbi:ATP synthase F1 subunit gamma [Nocardioides sp.]|uniref:ATP synthase F1 subunit gamma n=1 Tax=Nocardioides sp. TaxID=35761 RepID=UPI003565A2CE
MANRRVLVKRRKAARNIRKITRTMQLIATARFQSAYKRATAGKPYTEKLAELVGRLSAAAGGAEHPLLARPEGSTRTAMLVLTSTRGLCGAFNANVLRGALERVAEREGAGEAVDLHVVGKKGIAFMKFQGRELAERITGLGDLPRFDQIEPIANALMARFGAGEVGAVEVAYMKFVSTGRQRPVVEQLLPLTPPETTAPAGGPEVEYEFSPPPAELLADLLPAAVRVRLYQAFTDSAVSEQVARMVAMKAATDAAEEMIRRLTQQYNRARQTAITMELLDIVGGANALA